MAANAGKLTALAIKNAKLGKHFDGGGLFLHVHKNGACYWRMKYRHAGTERSLAFAVYPEVSLASARACRDANSTVIELEHSRLPVIGRSRPLPPCGLPPKP